MVTSPPYWGLCDYNVDGQIGLENTVEEFVSALVDVFREVKRFLKDDGTVWLNLGDAYAGSGKGAWSEKIYKSMCMFRILKAMKRRLIISLLVCLGVSHSHYKLMDGIYDRTLFGVNQIRCLKV